MTVASEVAALVGITPASCRRIAKGAHRRYKVFYVPKRKSGKLRRIAQPAREVKAVQRAIIQVLRNELRVHEAATAYRKGASIASNAKLHCMSSFLTKLDFMDFFASIDALAIRQLLHDSIPGIRESDVEFILNACLWYGDGRRALCVGAPSSPLLSNAVMYQFDSMMHQHAMANACVYSRYSDDITISSSLPDVLRTVENDLRSACTALAYPKLVFNDAKRVAVGRSTAMRVTGLTLANQGVVTVGRLRKRGVRSGAHRFVHGALSSDEQTRLKGEIAFVLSIEPSFRSVLEGKYGNAIVDLLPREQSVPDGNS